MRLSFVNLCGFRGFRSSVRIDFAEDFTIIDGRNGVGKSTIFDAIEFTLTGDLSKYSDAKALRESVSDYVWWVGGGDAPDERFVEVGFFDSEGQISVRRTPLGLENETSLRDLSGRLCNLRVAPAASISQLCTTSIIRDEQITSLSLDMGETARARYTLLRDALGASDAEKWITRAAALVAAAKKRTALAEKEVIQANADLSSASRRLELDEARASLASDEAVSKAAERLREFTGVDATADQLAGPTRERIAKVRSEISDILWLADEWPKAVAEQARQGELQAAVQEAEQRTLQASELLAKLPAADNAAALLSEATAVSRDLVTLVLHDLGKIAVPDRILLKNGPLNVEERAVIQTHPTIGADLVQELHTLDGVRPIIRHHHERFDGSGYPDGLAGEEIPLGARIMAVVDVYDALRTERPYKFALAMKRPSASSGRRPRPILGSTGSQDIYRYVPGSRSLQWLVAALKSDVSCRAIRCLTTKDGND